MFVTRLFVWQETLIPGGGRGSDELLGRLQAERIQLHSHLQRCMCEIQQLNQKVSEPLTQDQPPP